MLLFFQSIMEESFSAAIKREPHGKHKADILSKAKRRLKPPNVSFMRSQEQLIIT
ncbi:hypothetical protein RUM_01750 [Ruminococcus champanellensis 18P13 = JCM 17042]|uniref:Uncharacterized protein n=1 Tax=Ruminococcus champanellensis (strain DSM 18848 / JCM 17042 / KCTC 15320 / 18P13) TaxID=213810 RepID=D4L9Y5_RUMC1|nr:hypothetical protein RUM_01750 [Ruminococcus champanellensis 18P13 = JCM 17042]